MVWGERCLSPSSVSVTLDFLRDEGRVQGSLKSASDLLKAADGKENLSSSTNKISQCVFHVWGSWEQWYSKQSLYISSMQYIRSFGRLEESHLAADKSIWDEFWSPRAVWRSPSPHLGSVIERSPRSCLRPPVGRLQGKCGQTGTRADEQDQSTVGRRLTLEKPSQATWTREEEQREAMGVEVKVKRRVGVVLMRHFIALYC